MSSTLKIEGVNELQKATRALGKDALKNLAAMNKKIAKQLEGQGRSAMRGGTRQQAKAATAVRARWNQKKAAVGISNTRKPFALGAEFGAKQYLQFDVWTGSGDSAGYSFWPEMRREFDDGFVTEMYEDYINDSLKRLGLK